MNRLLLLCTLVASSSGFALTSGARLLPDESPAQAAPAQANPPPSRVKLTPSPERMHWGNQFIIGAATGAVAVPGSMYLAEAVRRLSNNTYASLVPSLLIMGILPPLAITLACWLTGNTEEHNPYRFWPAFLVNLVVNGVALAIAQALGMSVLIVPRVVLYSIVQAVIQPAGATLMMRGFADAPAPLVISNHDAIAPSTYVVKTGSWSF